MNEEINQTKGQPQQQRSRLADLNESLREVFALEKNMDCRTANSKTRQITRTKMEILKAIQRNAREDMEGVQIIRDENGKPASVIFRE